LNLLVESSLRRVADDAAVNRITIVREFAADLPPLLLDVKKCQQAVVHLLNNAIEAMPAGGTLTLQTLRDPGAAGEGPISLRISDTGRGVPTQVLGKVFDPFFSAEKSERNAGLGLTVAREIIQAHGGTISIDNGAAGGARVSVTLAGSSDSVG
jgi:two-component system NtrC family sensor kinase